MPAATRPESRDRIYDDLRSQAEAFLAQGRSVVVDGTYIERRQRAPILELVRETQTPFLLVECSAPDEVVKARQLKREGEAWTTSEGRWEVYLAQKQRIEPATELPESQRLAIDTTTPLVTQIDAVVERLGH